MHVPDSSCSVPQVPTKEPVECDLASAWEGGFFRQTNEPLQSTLLQKFCSHPTAWAFSKLAHSLVARPPLFYPVPFSLEVLPYFKHELMVTSSGHFCSCMILASDTPSWRGLRSGVGALGSNTFPTPPTSWSRPWESLRQPLPAPPFRPPAVSAAPYGRDDQGRLCPLCGPSPGPTQKAEDGYPFLKYYWTSYRHHFLQFLSRKPIIIAKKPRHSKETVCQESQLLGAHTMMRIQVMIRGKKKGPDRG